MPLDDFVNVSVRLKPAPKRKSFQHSLKVISTYPAILLSVDKQQTFNFDKIFSEDSTQEDVFKEIVEPLVRKVKEGYNCTIFAYGQTGTGKTYTMGTNPEEKTPGIISRTLEDFFSSDNDQQDYDVHISFMEIYNEKVYDLLRNNDRIPLSVKGLRIDGLSREKVFNVYEAKHFLELGGRNRHTGETKQNLSSSRSHAIFSIYFTISNGDRQMSSKLNLVDLAGSESVKKTGTQGSSFQEGININKGLLCIGQVMTALSTNLPFIPYRQSVITTILQDSLNKNNYISLIACVKTGIEDSSETIQALEFAQRVKRMRNKPEINQVVAKFKNHNPTLFEKNVRLCDTPLRRIQETPLKKGIFKKPKYAGSVLSNLSVPSSTTIDSSKSATSISSITSEMGSNFSPVIKKYMSKFESTIIEKLQSVIQDTLKRPTRNSAGLSVLNNNKENTPQYSWNQIQQKVSKLVQDEILQATAKANRATSSPLDHVELQQAKRILQYSNPHEVKDAISENYNKSESLIEMNNSGDKRTPCMSPINDSSLEKQIVDFSFAKPLTPIEFSHKRSSTGVPLRRSRRLTLKKNCTPDNGLQLGAIAATKNLKCSRRSTRNRSVKSGCECTNQTKSKAKKMQSPGEKRATEVLHILNHGDKKDLQKLSTIGNKTADRILLFRQVQGSFKSVEELSNLPGWSTTLFQNFISQNFLRI